MRGLVSFFLSLRVVMLIGSLGALMGSLVMFLQGSLYLTVPVLEAVDSFLFGIVLVIFAYGVAIGFVFTLPEGYGKLLPAWMNVAGVGQLKETLTEVVVVVLIVIFARTVVEAEGKFDLSMLVLPRRCA